jgi:hypothetical protein
MEAFGYACNAEALGYAGNGCVWVYRYWRHLGIQVMEAFGYTGNGGVWIYRYYRRSSP